MGEWDTPWSRRHVATTVCPTLLLGVWSSTSDVRNRGGNSKVLPGPNDGAAPTDESQP